MSFFRHDDGRIIKRTPAGGTGGGVTSHFDELASADEAAEFEHAEIVVEAGLIDEPEAPVADHPNGDPAEGTVIIPGPDHDGHADGEIRPSEAEPNA